MTDDMRAGARRDLEEAFANMVEEDTACRASVAGGWKADPQIERMRALCERDPERFDQLYGGRGQLMLGIYEAGERAAAGERKAAGLAPDDAA